MIARVVLLAGRVVGICTPSRAAAGVTLVAIVVVVGSKVLAVVAWVEVDTCPRLVCCLGHEWRRVGREERR